MCRISRFVFTIIQSALLIDSTKQSKIKYATMAFKAVGNTIKKPIMKTIGNAGSKFVQDLGKKVIHKYKAPQLARSANNLVRAEGKKNIWMRSADMMNTKGLKSILNTVSKSKHQAPFAFVGGMKVLQTGNELNPDDISMMYANEDDTKVDPFEEQENAFKEIMDITEKKNEEYRHKNLSHLAEEKKEVDDDNKMSYENKEKDKANSYEKISQLKEEKIKANQKKIETNEEKKFWADQEKNKANEEKNKADQEQNKANQEQNKANEEKNKANQGKNKANQGKNKPNQEKNKPNEEKNRQKLKCDPPPLDDYEIAEAINKINKPPIFGESKGPNLFIKRPPVNEDPNKRKGSVFVIRHSDKVDDAWRERTREPPEHKYDYPITEYAHRLFTKGGNYFKGKFNKMPEEKRDEFKFRVVSSPYYRCLQTSMQICKAIGYENIYEKKLFIEDAVEEWYNKEVVPENIRKKRYWKNDWSEEKSKELRFKKITPVHNQLFDYIEYPELKAKYNEGLMTDVTKRFSKVYDLLIKKNEEDPNVANIVVSHDASIESIEDNVMMDAVRVPWRYAMINQLQSSGLNEKGLSTYERVYRLGGLGEMQVFVHFDKIEEETDEYSIRDKKAFQLQN